VKLPCEFCGEPAEVPPGETVKSDTTLHHKSCDREHGMKTPGDGVNLYRSIVLADLTDAGREAVMNAITGDGVIKPLAGFS
jgi:hypothetical protein